MEDGTLTVLYTKEIRSSCTQATASLRTAPVARSRDAPAP